MNTTDSNLPRLGIDVSKATFDVHLCLAERAVRTAAFANNSEGFAQLETWLKHQGAACTLAGLEATGAYGVSLLWHLHQRGHRVHQLNPRRVKDYARSQGKKVKTDRTDAAVIAAYLKASDDLQPWQPPAQALLELQALVRRRTQVLDQQQAERNRQQSSPSKVVAASLQRLLKLLKDEVKRLDKALDEHVQKHAQVDKSVRLLRSIPGVGRLTAVTILAEVPTISAFSRARDVAAYAGLTPALAQSGTSVRRRGRITKEGSALLRKMLYMAALQAVKRSNNVFHQTYLAFVERGKPKLCAICALMHKLLRIAFGVLKHDTPFVENFARS